MKKKIILILLIINFLILGTYKTYSAYRSSVNGSTDNFEFAKIVFNNEETTNVSTELNNFYPGSNISYDISIANNKNGIRSEVNVEYKLIIETYHIIPTIITIKDSSNNQILICNEQTGQFNTSNQLVCESDFIDLSFSQNENHNYTVQVMYDDSISSSSYANLVDAINIKINSRQKESV